MIGQTISHYKILEKLGERGMSQNFLRSRLVGRVVEVLRISRFLGFRLAAGFQEAEPLERSGRSAL